MASDSASSTLLLLLALTVAALVREALGMVKRSPLPDPPLEMSPCRLLLWTASSSDEGEEMGEGGSLGKWGP
jgi:hypothetical protein